MAEAGFRRQPTRGADQRGTIGIDGGVLFGLGEVRLVGRFGLGRQRDRGITEPISGTLHRRGVHRCLGFFAFRLHALQFAQPLSHLTHHAGGLGATAQSRRKVVSVMAGEAEAVHGAGVGGDNLGGELGLESVGGMQSGDAIAASSRAARSSGVSVGSGGRAPQSVVKISRETEAGRLKRVCIRVPTACNGARVEMVVS